MVWGCFAAEGPGQLTILESSMNILLCTVMVLKEYVKSSVKNTS